MGTWEPEGGGETKNQQLLFLVHKKNENLSGAFVQNANQDTSVEALLEAPFYPHTLHAFHCTRIPLSL